MIKLQQQWHYKKYVAQILSATPHCHAQQSILKDVTKTITATNSILFF
jgi:hypothetical protein